MVYADITASEALLVVKCLLGCSATSWGAVQRTEHFGGQFRELNILGGSSENWTSWGAVQRSEHFGGKFREHLEHSWVSGGRLLLFTIIVYFSNPGQFWNVPITLESYLGPAFRNQDAYIITFTHPDAPGPRRFVGVRSRWTWEKRYELCLYVGNRQAGPLYEVENPNDPVIEGVYTDYRVTSLFGTEYRFSHFDSSRCTNWTDWLQ